MVPDTSTTSAPSVRLSGAETPTIGDHVVGHDNIGVLDDLVFLHGQYPATAEHHRPFRLVPRHLDLDPPLRGLVVRGVGKNLVVPAPHRIGPRLDSSGRGADGVRPGNQLIGGRLYGIGTKGANPLGEGVRHLAARPSDRVGLSPRVAQ